MRIFKSKVFSRFARKAGLDDAALRSAIDSAGRGLIDADLGGGVIKQRIARPDGGGKSGGFRTIILFRTADRAIFVYGFGKSERDNISDAELTEFRRLAAVALAYGDDEIRMAVETGALIEVGDGQAIP